MNEHPLASVYQEDIQLAKNKVDFTEANEVLKEKRIESLEILKKMIEE